MAADTLPNKKVPVASKYGDGTQSTLCATVIKAVNAVCAPSDGENAADDKAELADANIES